MLEVLSNPILATIIFLGILVAVHEFGHFIVGKLGGIAVEIFSLGFGPVLLQVKRGETSYRLSAIPLGGFVKFYGTTPSEPVPDAVKGREYHRAPVWIRMLTIAAGPFANFVLAAVAFALIGMNGIEHPKAIVGELMPGSPAEKAGLEVGDSFITIDGQSILNWRDLRDIIADKPGENINLRVQKKNGEEKILSVVPEPYENEYLGKTQGRIGISPNALPPILTIASEEARAKGFQTGDEILRIKTGFKETEIDYFRYIDEKLSALAAQTDSETITFIVRNSLDEKAAEREISYQTREITQISGSIVTSLGLESSELTIAEVDKEKNDNALVFGDRIVAWNEQQIDSIFVLSELMTSNESEKIDLTVDRAGELITVQPKLKRVEVQKLEGKSTIYTLPVKFLGGLEQGELVTEQYSNPFSALAYGISETITQAATIGGAVIGLFTGDMPLKALGGPIAIAKVASDSVKLGLVPFLTLLALISINLGLLNLVPIPVLDGGQMVMVATEGVLRRPLPEAAIEGYQKIGFVMILAVIAMVTYNDLGRFWASMVSGF